MLIKRIIVCFPSRRKFIRYSVKEWKQASYERLTKVIIVLGNSPPFLGSPTIKTWVQRTFSTINGMAWIFDILCQKEPAMLTLQDFRVMPFEKKCDVITFYGNYLAQRSLADCKVFLYFTEGFFIEVFYSPKYKKVLMINAFEKPIGLDPYLDKISLVDLMTV